jgi:uncharacterized protein YdeI (YjbR/CyaY-like superfamily)
VKPKFFATPLKLRAWFRANHQKAFELLLGYYKRGSGRPSVTWPESVDEALCVGWIDGVRRSLDAERYTIRFTPRRKGSNWSALNIARMKALIADGRVLPAGLRAFEARRDDRSAVYSYEQRKAAALDGDALAALARNAKAAAWFGRQAPWYRRTAAHWVTSAKKDETRARRLATLIACCAKGEPVPPLKWP